MRASTSTSTSTSTYLLALAVLADQAFAATCYDRYRGYYYCNRLSVGARIAIGVCVGLGVLFIFTAIGLARRKRLQNQWKQYRPPAPQQGVGMADMSGNPYGGNPPPPTYATGGDSSYAYGRGGDDGPSPPPATYQPSTANNYGSPGAGGLAGSYYGTGTGNNDTAHSYEYEQQARMDAEKGTNPPGYDVESAGGNAYAAPSGPPPTATAGAGNNYASPTGPPPGR